MRRSAARQKPATSVGSTTSPAPDSTTILAAKECGKNNFGVYWGSNR